MFVIVVGFVLALIFSRLPLGIVGLFILSILDQKSPRAERDAQDKPTLQSQGVDKYKIAYIRETTHTGHKSTEWPASS
jgi:hypothetical protein